MLIPVRKDESVRLINMSDNSVECIIFLNCMSSKKIQDSSDCSYIFVLNLEFVTINQHYTVNDCRIQKVTDNFEW